MLVEPWEGKALLLALEPATTSYEEYNDIPAAMRVQKKPMRPSSEFRSCTNPGCRRKGGAWREKESERGKGKAVTD
jgi:hypothetical protein